MLQPVAKGWVSILVLMAATGAAVACLLALFGSGDREPVSVVSVHGETVELYGIGVYANDSLMVASGNLGVDLVTLVVGVPLLLSFAAMYRRGSWRGAVLLSAMLGYFAYLYASRTLSVMVNDLFLLYVLVFSTAFFALFMLVSSLVAAAPVVRERLPRNSFATVCLATAGLTFALWMESPVTALLASSPPSGIEHYSTLVTHGLDLAFVVPLLAASGVAVLRGRVAGYLIGVPLLGLVAMLAPSLTAMTLSQMNAGVVITPPELAAYVIGFVLLGLAASWALAKLIAAVWQKGCMS